MERGRGRALFSWNVWYDGGARKIKELKYSEWFYIGLVFYIMGICLCAVTVICFSFPDDMGMNRNGIYKFSRNPMYVAYFICFAGMAVLTRSLVLLAVLYGLSLDELVEFDRNHRSPILPRFQYIQMIT